MNRLTAEAESEAHGPPLTPLQTRAGEYIARHGLGAFMDEDYNLTGTRARAVVREQNVALAAALGLPLAGRALPVAIDRKDVWAVIEGPRRAANRAELAAFFADPRNVPSLGTAQRLYLEWHYCSPDNYQFTLEKQCIPLSNTNTTLPKSSNSGLFELSRLPTAA